MAFISKTGISTDNIIEASQITNIIDAFDGTTANQIYMSGPVTASNFHATGSMNGTFSGTLSGNATSATSATTATTSITASYAIKAQNAYTASLAVTASYTISSSFSTTASYVSYSDYSAFTQIKTIPLVYTGYGSGSNLPTGGPVKRVASTILPIASLGFLNSNYAGMDLLTPYAESVGNEPLYIKFVAAGSGSLGLNGGTGGVPYIVGPTEVVAVDCYLNSPNSIGGSAGLVNPSWTTNSTSGTNSAYVYLWNNGAGPLYRLETSWQSVNMTSFNNESFLGVDMVINNGTSVDMTVDQVTMYISLQKP